VDSDSPHTKKKKCPSYASEVRFFWYISVPVLLRRLLTLKLTTRLLVIARIRMWGMLPVYSWRGTKHKVNLPCFFRFIDYNQSVVGTCILPRTLRPKSRPLWDEGRSIWLCRIWGSHNDGYAEFSFLGYNAVQSVESQSTFRRNMLLPSSGSYNKSSKKPAWQATWFHAHFLLALFFDLEDWSDMFLRNVSWLSIDYMVLYPRRENCS
jgi:hypothetical protein